MNMLESAHRVAAGAEWLDRTGEDWIDDVSLDKLDLSDFCNCVLGQIVGNYSNVAASFGSGVSADCPSDLASLQLEHGLTLDEAVELGFHAGPDDGDDVWRALTIEWATLILNRRITRRGSVV